MPILNAVKPLATAIAALALLYIPATATAQDNLSDAHRTAARNMVIAIGGSQQLDLVLPLILRQMERTFAQFNPELSEEFASVFDALRPNFETLKNAHIDRLAASYARDFSIEHLNTITAFHKSEAGQKYVRIKRELEKYNARTGREFSEELGREIDKQVRAEMKKRGHDF